MQSMFPRSIRSGGPWIWFLPCIVLGGSLAAEARAGPKAELVGFFVFPHRPGLDGIRLILLTLPFLASCCFSIGVWLVSKPAATQR